jgi:hypothetical protein
MTVNLQNGQVALLGLFKHGQQTPRRPCHSIPCANFALLVGYRFNSADRKDVTRAASPPAAERNGDGFFAITRQ